MTVLKHQMAALNPPVITAQGQSAATPAAPALPPLPKNPNLWCKCINLRYPDKRQFTVLISDNGGLHSCFDIAEDPLKPQSSTYGGGCLTSTAQMPKRPTLNATPEQKKEGDVIKVVNDDGETMTRTQFDAIQSYEQREKWVHARALREYASAVAAQETSAINLARMAGERLEKLKFAKERYDEAQITLAANSDLAAKQMLPKSDVLAILEKNKIGKDSLNLPNDPVSFQDFDKAFTQGTKKLEEELARLEEEIRGFQPKISDKKNEAQKVLDKKQLALADRKKVRNEYAHLFAGKDGSAIPPGPDTKGRIIANIQSDIVPGADIAPGSEQMKKWINDSAAVKTEDWGGDPSLVNDDALDFMVAIQEGLQLRFNCAAWRLGSLKDDLIKKFNIDRSISKDCMTASEGDFLVDEYKRQGFYSKSSQLDEGKYTHPTWNDVEIKIVDVEDDNGDKTGNAYKIESTAFGAAECRPSNDSGIFDCLSSDGSVPYRLGVLHGSGGKGSKKFHLIKNYLTVGKKDSLPMGSVEELLPMGSVFFFEKIEKNNP